MKTLQLKNGAAAKLDDEDYEKLKQYSWFDNKGYAVRGKREGGCVYMHHDIIGNVPGMRVDHINRDKLDNQRSNLRIVDHATNIQNGRQQKSLSGYRGVFLAYGKWRYRIMCNGKGYGKGVFGTAVEAAWAYDEKARELFGPHAATNFPLSSDSTK